MDIDILKESIVKTATYSFARSGGPGGQNVNKVNTKVFITVNIPKLDGLTFSDINRITDKLSNKLDIHGSLTISVEDERTQLRNREISIERITNVIIKANHQDKKRVPTKPKKGAKLKRLQSKKIRAEVKSNRKKVDF